MASCKGGGEGGGGGGGCLCLWACGHEWLE